MSYFIGELDTRLVDERKDLHKLLHSFGFYSSLVGERIDVPFGFVTDFASVPRIVGAWLLYGGKGKKAAVIHDWLYSSQRFTREIADAIFKEALEASGYAKWEVAGMYAGVRLGGWVAWRKDNAPQPAHIDVLFKDMEAP